MLCARGDKNHRGTTRLRGLGHLVDLLVRRPCRGPGGYVYWGALVHCPFG
jgi:hypothetical protein